MTRFAAALIALSVAGCPDRQAALQAQVARLLKGMSRPVDPLPATACATPVALHGPGTSEPNVDLMFECEPACGAPTDRYHLSFGSPLARFWDLAKPGRAVDANQEPLRSLLPRVEPLRYLVRVENSRKLWLAGRRELNVILVDLDSGRPVCWTTVSAPMGPECGDRLRDSTREAVGKMGIRTTPEFWATVTHTYPPDLPKPPDPMKE